MKRPSLPRVAGAPPRQAHVALPAGTYEREFGSDGFYGPATHVVHAHPPTDWSAFEGPLRPRAFDLGALRAPATSPWAAVPVLRNADCALRLLRLDAPMDHLVRNADGDELLFAHEGAGELFCDFGHLHVREGDYVVLPRGTQWRIDPQGSLTLLLVEATSAAYGLPDRGLLGRHALFDPALLETPALDAAFEAQKDERPWRVVIKRRAQLSTVTFPHNPLDAVAVQGDLFPFRLNWRDIRPVTSARYHLPPSAHTTFVSDRFVVCTFCPRPLESDPSALKLPFFHSNNDYDEVLFYHRGQFTSRDDIKPGMLSLHPAGFPHGPHPKALAAAERAERSQTDEVAVMIDTLDPLEVSPQAETVELTGYVKSWTTPR
ncbi:MAG: homogentisate 1,2-dioxygenase [Polyangiales bacterium]